MTTGREKLIIFVKAPRPGSVKTRLAQSLGPEAACAAYQTVVAHFLARLKELDSVELRYSPDNAFAEIKAWLRPTWIAAAQGSGDLGQRLSRAFTAAFSAGFGRVVMIGSDCPFIEAADVQTGWGYLTEPRSLVLGPALDGGYWLIGLSQAHPSLFHEIAWSTNTVLDQTLQRAGQSGLKVKLLRQLRDIDTIEDWQHFLSQNPNLAAESTNRLPPRPRQERSH